MPIKVTDLPLLNGSLFGASNCVRLCGDGCISSCADIQNQKNPIEIYDSRVYEVCGYTRDALFRGCTGTTIGLMFIENHGDDPMWVHLMDWLPVEDEVSLKVEEIENTTFEDFKSVYMDWRETFFNPKTNNKILDAIFYKLNEFANDSKKTSDSEISDKISCSSLLHEAIGRWKLMIEHGYVKITEKDKLESMFKLSVGIW